MQSPSVETGLIQIQSKTQKKNFQKRKFYLILSQIHSLQIFQCVLLLLPSIKNKKAIAPECDGLNRKLKTRPKV
jgi:hypothetical protein